MKQIIVPTDFSDAAWNALLYAVKLAEEIKAEILILNAYQEPHSGASTLVSLADILREDSEKGIQKLLQKIEATGLGSHVTIAEKSLHLGLVEAVNSQIKEHDEHLVVMGSLGETGTLEKLMGSNASDMVNKSRCPVLIVPPNAGFSSLGRIVYAMDFDHVPEKEDLSLLKVFASLNPSGKLDAVHVTVGGKSEAEIRDTIKSILKDILYDAHIISGDDVSDALDEYVSQTQTDLLVLVKKKKGFLERIFQENVIKDLALSVHIPLLILKAEDE